MTELELSEVDYVVPADDRLKCAGQIRKAIVTRAWNDTCVNLKVVFLLDDLADDHAVEPYAEQHRLEVSFRRRVLRDPAGSPGTFN